MNLEQTFHKKLIFHDVEQQTPDWFLLKLGMVTASKMPQVKSSDTGRRKYMLQLIGERLSGIPKRGFTGVKSTDYGNEYEGQALACHELEQGLTIQRVGFIEISPDLGVSPDGLIDDDGMVEAKCRYPHIQLETILRGQMPPQDRWQVQFSLWGLGRDWCDYVSFCPDIKTSARYFTIRIYRDTITIALIRDEVVRFLNEMISIEASLNNGSAIASRELLK